MDKFIRDWICKDSDLQAIAVLSEIAFPGYDVDSEDVRKALQVTVAAARRGAAIRKNTIRVLKGKKT